MPILESRIEKAFLKEAKKKGYYAPKFKTIGRKGAPDRIVFGHNRIIFFVEFKKPGEIPDIHQFEYHKKLESYGFEVLICDNLELKMVNSKVLRSKE